LSPPFIEFERAKYGSQGSSGFAYSDFNAIVGKDQSGVGGGKLGGGHIDGRWES